MCPEYESIFVLGPLLGIADRQFIIDANAVCDYYGIDTMTGIAEFGDAIEPTKIGERIVCLERCFNVREGFGRTDDTLPKRMLTEPLEKAGPASGQTVAVLDTLLDEYYQALGYTSDGVPTPEKLEDLGLEPLH